MKRGVILLASLFVLIVLPFASSMTLCPNTGEKFHTYNYVFNMTNQSNCSEVILSYSNTVTTNFQGVACVDIPLSSIGNQIPQYLCEYKDGNLRKVHNFSEMVFNSLRLNNLTVKYNITADWLNGKVNWSNIINAPSFSTNESDPLAYNGTLAFNSSLAGYYPLNNPNNFTNKTNLSQFTNDINVSQSNYSNYSNFSYYANQSTWWANVNNWVAGWFQNTGNSLDFNETKLNTNVLNNNFTKNNGTVGQFAKIFNGTSLTGQTGIALADLVFWDGSLLNISSSGSSTVQATTGGGQGALFLAGNNDYSNNYAGFGYQGSNSGNYSWYMDTAGAYDYYANNWDLCNQVTGICPIAISDDGRFMLNFNTSDVNNFQTNYSFDLIAPRGIKLNGSLLLSNYTTNGFIKTINSDGTVTIDTNSYCYANGTNCTASGLSWGEATNGTLMSQATFNTNYSANDGAYRNMTNTSYGVLTANQVWSGLNNYTALTRFWVRPVFGNASVVGDFKREVATLTHNDGGNSGSGLYWRMGADGTSASSGTTTGIATVWSAGAGNTVMGFSPIYSGTLPAINSMPFTISTGSATDTFTTTFGAVAGVKNTFNAYYYDTTTTVRSVFNIRNPSNTELSKVGTSKYMLSSGAFGEILLQDEYITRRYPRDANPLNSSSANWNFRLRSPSNSLTTRIFISGNGGIGFNQTSKISTLSATQTIVYNTSCSTATNNSVTIVAETCSGGADNTQFLSDVGIGDEVFLSSNTSATAIVTAITNDTYFTVNRALGNGVAGQKVSVRKGLFRLDNSTNSVKMFVSPDGYMTNGNITPRYTFQWDGNASISSIQSTNVTIDNVITLSAITLPACDAIYNGSIGRNSSSNKPAYCDGTTWTELY